MLQLLNEPEKSIVIKIAKRNMKKNTRAERRRMAGIARPSEMMDILRSLLRDISLSGRKILRILIAFRKPTETESPKARSTKAETTMRKSRMFHVSLR